MFQQDDIRDFELATNKHWFSRKYKGKVRLVRYSNNNNQLDMEFDVVGELKDMSDKRVAARFFRYMYETYWKIYRAFVPLRENND